MGCTCRTICVCDYPRACKSRYGLFHFLLDVFLTFVTGGFWLIWIFIREMRGR